MLKNDCWLLPEGIQEVLPPQALRMEYYRRLLLDLYRSWGYELVEPPLIDFLESLLTGTGHDLQLMTFTLTDQMSGRLLGVRADMTPQIARIDAHHMHSEHPSRFCYVGEVLQTRLEEFAQSRSPMQTGIELYGHGGPESDIEVLSLMVETLQKLGLEKFHIDLGHVGIFRELARQAGISAEVEDTLFDALQRKAVTEIREILAGLDIEEPFMRQFLALVDLNGDMTVLDEAREQLAGEKVRLALDNLESIASGLLAQYPELTLYFDLAELRGYNYHTGVVFAAYLPGHGQDVAQGGRYDGIGGTFGRSRAATGFSTDLAHLVSISEDNPEMEAALQAGAIFAPAVADKQLDALIRELRSQNEIVVRELPGQVFDAETSGCDRKLDNATGRWEVVTLK